MVAQRPNMLIVTVREGDIDRVKKRVSEVAGVTDITYNYITHKLHVRYEGDERRLYEIQLEIRRILGEASAEASSQDKKHRRRLDGAQDPASGLRTPTRRKGAIRQHLQSLSA